MASLAADQLIFNSKWNLESFLGNMNSHLKIIPDFRNGIEKRPVQNSPGYYCRDTFIILLFLTYTKKDQKI